MSDPLTASCSCGAVRLGFTDPIVRARCHCTICQRENRGPHGEPVALWRHRVRVETGADRLAWKRTRWLPVHVNRGRCAECDDLILEHVAGTPFSIVIGDRFDDPHAKPPLAGHMFYDKRVADADDDLPKHSGYLSSQLGFTSWVLRGLLHRS